MKLIHITDTHVVMPGQRLYGLDPRARLDAAVADINRHHADASLVVVTGDLTHWGDAKAYDAFVDSIGALTMPVVALVGNHDRREVCREHVRAVLRDANGYLQGLRDTHVGRFVFLDTLDEKTHAGQMCDKRFAWFERALGDAPKDLPIYVFMHHPPFAVGVKAMDDIALREAARFKRIVDQHPGRIRHIFFGHVHRPISGSWNGIPFSTLRGTNHQVALTLDPAAPHLASHEPPAYAIVVISLDSVIVHTHDYLDASPLFPFSKPGVDERIYALGAVVG